MPLPVGITAGHRLDHSARWSARRFIEFDAFLLEAGLDAFHQFRRQHLLTPLFTIPHAALNEVKQATDHAVLANRQLLDNPDYFEKQQMPIVVRSFRDVQPPGPDAATCRLINQLLAGEYLNESQGHLPF